MKRVEGVKRKVMSDSTICYMGYVRFFSNGKYIYQNSTGITRMTRQDALLDAKQL